MSKPLEVAMSFPQIDALLETLPVAVFRIDARGVMGYANATAEQLLGLERRHLAGRRYDQPALEVTDIEGQPLDFENSPVPRALRGETTPGFEVRVFRPGDSAPRLMSFDTTPYHDDNGAIAGALVVAHDITASRQDRDALRASQQRLNSVLNNTRMAVFLMDERQFCVYANTAAEALTGYRFDEMQDRPLHDVVHHTRPDGSHYPLHECPIDRAFPQDFQVEGEETFVHRDGSFYPVAFTASPIRDEASRTVGTVIEVRGVAEDKRREAERQEVEGRFRNMADHAPVMMWVTAVDGRCTYLNRLWYEFTGQTEADALGFGWLDAVHEEDRGWSGETFLAANARHEPFRLEYRLRRPDGSYRWAIDAAAPRFSPDGQFLGYIGSVLDIDDRHESERRLREAEERYRLALAATRDAIWDWDLLNDRVLWNEALESAHGWRPAEVEPGRSWWLDQIHADDRQRIEHSIRAVIDGHGSDWAGEYRFRRADGSYADIFDRGTVLRDEAGRALRMIGAMLDQTEQKRQQAALRDSEAMLRHLTDAMPAMAWIARIDGDVEWFNAGWYAYIGSQPGSDLGSTWVNHLHPDDREGAMARWRAAVARGGDFENEHRFRGANGRYRWFLARGTPITNAAGEIARWFGTCTDIQELVEARNLLSRSREELAREVQVRTQELDRIWRISEDLYVVCGRDLVCRNVNPAWRAALGHEPDSLLGRRLDTLVEPGDLPRFTDGVAALSSQPEARDLDIRLRASDGSARWYSWNWRVDGDLLYAFGRDISRRVALEHQLRQSQKMETIGKLTGGVAHDFNNLLQVISGNLHLLARHVAGNTAAQTRVQNALSGVSRGAKLASQLLAFGRRQLLEPRVVDAGRLIQAMEDMLRRTLGEAIEVEVMVAPDLWNAFADPAQIENALLNLAINARDAMDGSGQLTIEAGNAQLDSLYCRQNPDCTPGQYVVLAVTDTGCGMTPEIAAQVFEPFFSTKPEGKGTGLGLSMVYGFATQSGGHVKLYTEPGHGTTVKLYLPRSAAAADEPIAKPSGQAQGGSETILVAEDDEEVRATVVELLSTLGYRVVKSKDADSALTVIESGMPIDLLFTDVVMPGTLRSPELARKARERLPGIAVLFTSGYTENAIVHGGRLDPGVELLSKPYTQDTLARKVRHVLANQQQRNLLQRAKLPPAGAETSASPASPAAPGAVPTVAAPRNPPASPCPGRVLLVEDDAVIREVAAELLRLAGFEVLASDSAQAALRLVAEGGVDVLVTDLGLPDLPGDLLAVRARHLQPGLALVFATGSHEVDPRPPAAVVLRKPYDAVALETAIHRAVAEARALTQKVDVGD